MPFVRAVLILGWAGLVDCWVRVLARDNLLLCRQVEVLATWRRPKVKSTRHQRRLIRGQGRITSGRNVIFLSHCGISIVIIVEILLIRTVVFVFTFAAGVFIFVLIAVLADGALRSLEQRALFLLLFRSLGVTSLEQALIHAVLGLI